MATYTGRNAARPLHRARRQENRAPLKPEKPIDLAESVLRGNTDWNRAKLLEAIEAGRPTTIHVPDPMPLHLVCRTVNFDAAGAPIFRRDWYARDRELIAALRGLS